MFSGLSRNLVIVAICGVGLCLSALPVYAMPALFSSADAEDTKNDALSQRLLVLERRVAANQQLELAEQIEQLQRQIEELRGQLEVQAHAVQLLQAQEKVFYEDLDARLKATQSLAEKPKLLAEQPLQVSSKEQAAYQQAFRLIEQKQYPQAVASFKAFLTQYPKSTYVPNAYYWLGEVYSLQNKLPLAVTAFQEIIKHYPKSSKNPDAMLKLGIIFGIMGNQVQADQLLSQVKKDYPNTSAARLASVQLQAIH